MHLIKEQTLYEIILSSAFVRDREVLSSEPSLLNVIWSVGVTFILRPEEPNPVSEVGEESAWLSAKWTWNQNSVTRPNYW